MNLRKYPARFQGLHVPPLPLTTSPSSQLNMVCFLVQVFDVFLYSRYRSDCQDPPNRPVSFPRSMVSLSLSTIVVCPIRLPNRQANRIICLLSKSPYSLLMAQPAHEVSVVATAMSMERVGKKRCSGGISKAYTYITYFDATKLTRHDLWETQGSAHKS